MSPLLLLLTALRAQATPPDTAHSTVTPLCRGGDRLALLVKTRSNQGMHFTQAVSIALVQLDAKAGTSEGVLMSSILDNHSETESPERSRTSTPVDMGQQLAAWGTEDCGTPAPLWLPDTESGSLELQRASTDPTAPPELLLRLGERQRTLGPTRLLAPDARWAPVPAGAPPPVAQAAEATFEVDDPEDLSLALGPPVLLDTTVAVPVAVAGLLWSNTVYAVVDRARFDAARAWLINATGLDRHRAGRHEDAASWFRMAAELDPEHPTPRFNLACAWAQAGRPGRTAAALASLQGIAGMAAKVAADPDFDPVRAAAPVQAAVAELD